MRDDFSQKTIETLAKRVGCRCSNPGCRKLTSGPHEEANKSVNIGVAAHITAAASGGKRYDVNRSSEQRKSIENGMWLCQNCGKLIDSDEQKYPVALLLNWKREAEEQAGLEIENVMPQISGYRSSKFDAYLSNLVDTPQSWWLDAIDDSTWYEFELFTQVQKNSKQLGEEKPQESPKPLLQAIDNVEKRAILITGAPGAGKSTFLEKLAIEAARKAQSDHNAPIPVLVELKDYDSSGEQSGIKGLIQAVLESHDPFLDLEATKQLLQGKGRTILLLIDGWNELSDEQAKSKIKTFCKPYCVIVTSRNAGDYWEIQHKFEIQPLSRSDVEDFFDKRLPNTERQRLRELVDRVRDFGQTPLMVWMLYSIFQDTGSTPETRGEVYREFTRLYSERAKEGIDLSDARKLLGKLAFEMMRSPNSEDLTDFRLKVSEVEAEDILGSEPELNRMLNHLLKQQGKLGNREISFCHQSLQEYYAAEYLRQELKQNPDWLKKQAGEEYSWFQIHYLNYLKWTEPIALMLGLPEINQDLAVQIVEQALAVDLMLGARLAGEVRSVFQEKTAEALHRKTLGKRSLFFLKNRFLPVQGRIVHTKVEKFSDINAKDIDIDSLLQILRNNEEDRTLISENLPEIAIDNLTYLLNHTLSQVENRKSWIAESEAEDEYENELIILSSSIGQAVSNLPNQSREIVVTLGKLKAFKTISLLWKAVDCFDLSIGQEAFQSIRYIQANCKFYNYEIYQKTIDRASPAKQQESPLGNTNNYYGDYIAGDKIQGDKILGNKTEAPNATEIKIFEQINNYHASPPRDPPS